MKNHRSDRYWVIAILFILVIEITWLLVDLQWIEIAQLSWLKRKSVQEGSKEAGYVMKSKDDLKRRGANSLIWEDTKEKDILFYQDSVLTLSQSTAKLYLLDETELQLSENTLVTLEEPTDKSTSEIRLRFSKGDLTARNPHSKTAIIGDDWVVNLEKGSEISLRKDKDAYEFEVISGAASLQTEKGAQNLTSEKILKLGNDREIISIEKNQSLQWKVKKPIRVYVFDEEAQVSLNWAGPINGLRIQKAGEEEVTQAVDSNQQTSQVNLKLGNYKVRMQDEKGVSTAQAIEVWKAPRIFLTKPLPRDRLPAGKPLEFVWTNEAGVKSYQIKFNHNQNQIKNESSKANFHSVQFEKEQNLNWEVEGFDEEGFAIPSFYKNEVYIREQPLEAPKLKVPQIRIPEAGGDQNLEKPKDGAWLKKINRWLALLASPVQATTKKAAKNYYEISFEWEPVPGADLYFLEVSSMPDFRKPELIQNLKTNQFTWQKAQYKKYYWRVASGTSKGRMGFFSEMMEIQYEDLVKVVAPMVAEEKKIENDEEKPVVQAAEPVQPQVVVTPPAAEPESKINLPTGWALAWMPSFKFVDMKGEQNAKIKLAGGVPIGVLLQYRTPNFGQKFYQLSVQHSQQTWKPTPESTYPFQTKIDLAETWVFLDYARLEKSIRYGLSVHRSFYPLRTSSETVSVKEVAAVGARASWEEKSENSKHRSLMAASLGFADKAYEFSIDAEYRFYLSEKESKTRFYLGTSGNTLVQKKIDGGGTQGNLNLLFGFDQF